MTSSKGFSYKKYSEIVNDGNISSDGKDIGKVLDDQNKLSKIKLYPEQIVHMQRLVNAARKHTIIFDQSDMGSGKTVVSLAQLKWWGYNGLVICPNSAKAVWRKHIDSYDVFNVVYKKTARGEVPEKHDIEVYNFELLSRGSSFPYMKKLVKTEGKNKIETFEPTPALDKLISNQNTFLIIDEAHSLKNTTSSRSQAAITFINHCIELAEKHKTKFKVLMCSGTLFDKPEHAKTFLRMMDILKSRNLFHTDPFTGIVKLEGLQEIIDASKAINPAKTREVLDKYPFDTSQKSASADVIAYQLFFQVIIDDHSSSMGTQKTITDAKQELENIYLNLTDNDYEFYSKGIQQLSESVASMARARMMRTRFEGDVWGGVMKSLQLLESSKCTSLAIHCYNKLVEDPKLKIVIGCWFVNSIAYLRDCLKNFGPMILTGAYDEKERGRAVEKFQQDSKDCRVIIGQMTIISQSISLDDTTGVYRREAYFIPNYQAVPLQQAAGRIHRKNTMSDSIVYYVYGKQFSTNKNAPINSIGTEIQLLSKLVEKGETLKSINKAQVETGKKFLDENKNVMDVITLSEYNRQMQSYKIPQYDIEKNTAKKEEKSEIEINLDDELGQMPKETKSERVFTTRKPKKSEDVDELEKSMKSMSVKDYEDNDNLKSKSSRTLSSDTKKVKSERVVRKTPKKTNDKLDSELDDSDESELSKKIVGVSEAGDFSRKMNGRLDKSDKLDKDREFDDNESESEIEAPKSSRSVRSTRTPKSVRSTRSKKRVETESDSDDSDDDKSRKKEEKKKTPISRKTLRSASVSPRR
jgi:hypothetical protein